MGSPESFSPASPFRISSAIRSANFAAPAATQAAHRVQESPETEMLTQAASALEALEIEMARVDAALRAIVPKPKGARKSATGAKRKVAGKKKVPRRKARRKR